MSSPRITTVLEDALAHAGRSTRGKALEAALHCTGGKPSSYLLKSWDTPGGTRYDQDLVWHLLKKEKSFDLDERGKLGLVNPNSDVSYFLGFGEGGGMPRFHFSSRTRVHLIDLWIEEFEIEDGLLGTAGFVPVDSSTLVVVLELSNPTGLSKDVAVCHVLARGDESQGERINGVRTPPQMAGSPSKYIGVHTTTGELEWSRYDEDADSVLACFQENDPSCADEKVRHSVGHLLFVMAGSMRSEGFRSWQNLEDAETKLRAGDTGAPGRYLGQSYRVFLKPDEVKVLVFSLGATRFSDTQRVSTFGVPTFVLGEETGVVPRELEHVRQTLGFDYAGRIRQSLEAYERFPAVDVPSLGWAADAFAAFELPRANTYSPFGKMRHPFYNFCRAQGTDLESWWSEGTACSIERSAFGTVITDPALAIRHLRGVFDHQAEDGRIPFCVNQNGEYSFHDPSDRGVRNETISPELSWQSWHAYLWTGDKGFLREAYEVGRRNLAWWLRNRDRTGEGLCYWLGIIEGVRDTPEPWIPTWREVPVEWQEALDLNCCLAMEEEHLAKIAGELGDTEAAREFQEKHDTRVLLMNEYMWDKADRCYYGVSEGDGRKIRVRDISTLMPLWCGIAPLDRARHLVDYYENAREFKTALPVPTLSMSSPEFDPGFHWFGPMWTWFNWLIVLGLRRYGYHRKASDLAVRTIEAEFGSLESTSHFREYYHSTEGYGIGLCDYIWSTLAGALLVQVLFGIEPAADGLRVAPALPDQWRHARISNLRVRSHSVSVSVEMVERGDETKVLLNGKAVPTTGQGGLIPWGSMPDDADVRILQPSPVRDVPEAPDRVPDGEGRPVPPHRWVWMGRAARL